MYILKKENEEIKNVNIILQKQFKKLNSEFDRKCKI